MSDAQPGCAKAGRLAVTMTAAVFLTWMVVGSHRHPHASQHVRQSLGGEYRLNLVAGSREPHYQAVSDQLVFPHALESDQILEPRHGGPILGCPEQRGQAANQHDSDQTRDAHRGSRPISRR